MTLPLQTNAGFSTYSLERPNGLRLSCNRASHVAASSRWPGAVDSSKRVLGVTAFGSKRKGTGRQATQEYDATPTFGERYAADAKG